MKSVIPFRTALLVLATLGLVAGGSALAKEVTPGWLGVSLQELSPAMARALQLDPDSGGVLISEVLADSPAETAGLEDGDVILEFAGKSIDDAGDLTKAVRRTDPGETVDVVLVRDGARLTFAVEIGERDDEEVLGRGKDGTTWKWHGGVPAPDGWVDDHARVLEFHGLNERGWLGLHLQSLGEQLGDYFGVENGEGVLIAEVEEDSPAAEAGLKAGDVIVAFDGEEVGSEVELRHAMRDSEPEQEATVTIVRRGNPRDVSVTLGEMPNSFDRETWIAAAPHVEMLRKAPRIQRWHLRDREMEEEGMTEMRRELELLREELEELREELKK